MRGGAAGEQRVAVKTSVFAVGPTASTVQGSSPIHTTKESAGADLSLLLLL